ncbi:hypothetical protein I3760_03G015400 [Carya illinoinensis]|nr:hypothetical protein I3760_03G015400 [Carya illinoinensis]
MKAAILVIICFLLLSLLFSPPSIVARELAAQSGSGAVSKNPNKGVAACGKPGTPAYSSCIAKPQPKRKCKRHTPYDRCGPT